MLDYVKPYCHPVSQLNFFCLKEQKSELQILYQTYFLRTKLKGGTAQKLNTCKMVLATFFQVEKYI